MKNLDKLWYRFSPLIVLVVVITIVLGIGAISNGIEKSNKEEILSYNTSVEAVYVSDETVRTSGTRRTLGTTRYEVTFEYKVNGKMLTHVEKFKTSISVSIAKQGGYEIFYVPDEPERVVVSRIPLPAL